MRAFVSVFVLSLLAAGCGSRQPEPAEPEPQPVEPEPAKVKAPPFRGWSGTQPGDIELDRWHTPESCSECHNEIYRQWQGTMHSNAGRDPLFLAAVEHLRDRVSGEVERNELRTCTRCHSAAGHLSAGAVDSFSDLSPLTELYERGGTFCDFCHNVSGSTPRDGWYEVEPGPGPDDMGALRGPRRDAQNQGHEVSYSELHTLASFCGTCHDQNHAGANIPVLATYSEWRDGPYNTGEAETTVVCQDCHMRQVPGDPTTGSTERPDRPGRSAPALGTMSPQRPHIWAHNFVGGNTLVPSLLADDVHGTMARERLREAATLELAAPDRATAGSPVILEVRVTNSGAGHNLPTGSTEIRQMWIELRITAEGDEVVYQSGVVDDEGALPEGTHTFGTVFGDEDGEPVPLSTQATRVLRDHRIGPRETAVERFELTLPQSASGTMTVTVRLRYRPASPAMVATLLGEAPEIAITDMAEARATFEVIAAAGAPAEAAPEEATPEEAAPEEAAPEDGEEAAPAE